MELVTQIKSNQKMWDLNTLSPKSEPALELISTDAPSVEVHHHSISSDAGRNSGGRRIIKKQKGEVLFKLWFCIFVMEYYMKLGVTKVPINYVLQGKEIWTGDQNKIFLKIVKTET